MKQIEVNVDQSTLVLDRGAQALKDAVTAIRNAMRAGTASTKGKGEVAGSNKKPWKQKGTGNARAGFRQSPVWRGGGVAHGPKPREYGFSINKKVKRLAMKSAFSSKAADDEIIVLDSFAQEEIKTKEIAKVLAALNTGKKTSSFCPKRTTSSIRAQETSPASRLRSSTRSTFTTS